MKSLLTFIIFISVFALAECRAEDTDARFHAGWKILRGDTESNIMSSDIYYFYADGVFVRQGYQRREFVTVGRWRIDEQKYVVIYEQQLRNTTLSPKELDKIKKRQMRFAVSFDTDTSMRWTRDTNGAPTMILSRQRDLPDRTENPSWGLGTQESYRRGAQRERAQLIEELKKKEANQQPEPMRMDDCPTI